MSYKQTPAQRLFTLTCCLLASPVNGLSKHDLFKAVSAYAATKNDEARSKMFERDKQSLRSAGIQLEVVGSDAFEDEDASRYRIAKGSFDWPKDFTLNPEKLQLLELAAKAWNRELMGQSARSGITRLRSLGLIEANNEPSVITPRLLARHQAFAPLADAIGSLDQVSFEYRKPDGTQKLRLVSPLRLRQIQGQWVLLAHDGKAIKNFLLRRIISQVKITAEPAIRVAKSEIEIAEQELVDFANSQVATLKIEPDSEAFWHFAPGPLCEIKVGYMDQQLLAEELLEFGQDVSVLEPESLAQALRESLQKVVNLHA